MSMATNAESAGGAGGGLASFEKELICSICTEVLYQPLTILNCLHTFCGSCVKEWFSHQHRKASSSRSSSSTANPYSCPTCRAEVRDVQHNATVSNLLELFLLANPTRDRSQEEKDEMNNIYKPDGTRPGERILPKVERRRERRARREEGEVAATRERQMMEEARLRSLRELDISSSASSLAPPSSDRTRSTSGEREERRQRRRERERQREQVSSPGIPHSSHSQQEEADNVSASLPVSSPRHPDAIETRQREQRMSHQASLRSLVSASESGTGTGDSIDEAQIMQQILDEGLLGGIDVETLNEAEQDMLAERIAELYRQRHPRRTATSSPPQTVRPASNSGIEQQQDYPHQLTVHRTSSTGRQRPPVVSMTTPTSEPRARSHSSRPQTTPPTSIARSNSNGASVTINHRRRASDQTRTNRAANRSRQSSVERPQASSSATALAEERSELPLTHEDRPARSTTRTNTEPTTSSRASDMWLQAGGEDRRSHPRNGVSPARSARQAQTTTMPTASGLIRADSDPTVAVAELDSTPIPLSAAVPHRYNEPTIACFRCKAPDIQYDISRHCRACMVDICMSCYRDGRGCKHWYGFGHAADINFEASKTTDENTERPHVLIGRQYLKPPSSAILETKPASRSQGQLPRTTTSDPASRLHEGHFCDRCGTFANTQFWLCDSCNDGEWGFCKSCVQTHHCCTHPLLPVAYYPRSLATELKDLTLNTTNANTLLQTPNQPGGTTSNSSSRPHTPNSTTSHHSRRNSGYDYLSINVNCDMCHQIIFPASLRYHCPFHSTDFDICIACYTSFVHHSRMRRDGNSSAETVAGWRKCPQGHRMIVLNFEADSGEDGDGGMRRVVKNDLVGGWKMNDTDIRAWNQTHNMYTASPPTSPPLSGRGTWSWKEDVTGTRKGQRSRASTLNNNGVGSASTNHSSGRFPPDGGFGQRGLAYYSYRPEDGDDGEGELKLPRGAEVTEVEDVNGDWWSGVYAGDIGVFPFGYVKEATQ